MIKNNKGFTLIEMLVVVGMIGVLAAAVLTALGPSRAKARDSRIVSGIQQAVALAEAQFDTTASRYPAGDSAFGSSQTAYDAVKADVAGAGGELVYQSDSNSAAFLVYSKLSSENTKFACADSSGKRNMAGSTQEPKSMFVCP